MAPQGWQGPRPVVIGAGPCGLLAALILAQMGLKPIIIERGKAVRARTKDTWGLWRRERADAGIQRAVRRRRRGHLLGRQALQPDQATRATSAARC
jgi:flavin-dependent dehydrogenase